MTGPRQSRSIVPMGSVTRPVAVTALLVAALSGPLSAQSLGEVGRQEEARRQGIKAPAKVVTNKDLGGGALASPAGSTAAPASSAPPTTSPAAKPAADGKPADAGKSAEAAGTVKDQAYWAGRVKALRAQVDRDETYRDALQSRVNVLTADFVGRDDPAQRTVIERDRQKAVAELGRLKTAIDAGKKAVADLEEEARRAGVPPGWLR